MKETPIDRVKYYLKEARKLVVEEWESTTIFKDTTDTGRVWVEIAKMIQGEEKVR